MITITVSEDGQTITEQDEAPKMDFPAEEYIKTLNTRRDSLQAEIDGIDEKLAEIEKQGVKVAEIQVALKANDDRAR